MVFFIDSFIQVNLVVKCESNLFFFFVDLGSIMRLFANILACLRPNKKNIYLVANNFLDYLTPD
jgi:uncharacterized membrane protein